MSWNVARAAIRVLNLVVLAVSGWYLILYLYRWEWNRALISGLFFVAAEIALATSFILDALRRAPPGSRATATTITAANGRRRPQSFAWLTRNHQLGVFVPVLLGAGVLLSGLAYLLERLAGAVAGPVVDRRSASTLPLDLPLGDGDARPLVATRPPARRPVIGWLVAATAVAILLWFAIDQLADATQSRPTALPTTGATSIDLRVERRRSDQPVEELAAALWISCSPAAAGATLEQLTPLSEEQVRLVVTPELGELRRRRVFGCFEDATLDRVWADVESWTALEDGA